MPESIIMRPVTYDSSLIEDLLVQERVASFDMVREALGTPSRATVYRKLAAVGARASYSHRGRYHTLDSIAAYDEYGLWSFEQIHFSIHGNLLNTLAHLVGAAPAGLFASELQGLVQVRVHTALAELYAAQRLRREQMGRTYLYLDGLTGDKQLAAREEQLRREAHARAVAGAHDEPEWAADMAFLLSVLDEKQRRLYLGLESIRRGHGGDSAVSRISGVNVKTIARGRRELQRRNVTAGRIRRAGAGRPSKKKRRR